MASVNSGKKVKGKVRMFDGKEVQVVLYNGRAQGHGKYFAGAVDNNLILDENKRPVPYRNFGFE